MSLSLTAAFLAGVLSFLSPCVLPLVPTYLFYLGGEGAPPLQRPLLHPGLWGGLLPPGPALHPPRGLLFEHRQTLARVGGVVLVLFGLYMLGLRPRWGFPPLRGETSRPLGAFLLGATLALGWTPCIGPILGAILTLTAVGGGVGFLLAYILGLAVPFFVVALFADRIKGWLRRAGRISHYVEVLAGVVLVLVGVLLFTGTFTALNTFFLRITPEWLQRYL